MNTGSHRDCCGYNVRRDCNMHFHPCDVNMGVITQQLLDHVEILKWGSRGANLRVKSKECTPNSHEENQEELHE